MSFIFKAHEYPESPGCYLMMNEAGNILYIGKSINLRSRLRSYFQQNDTRRKIRQMVREIAKIEVILVNNEAESLLLENNLIKLHKPPYNRALKKEKSGYAYLQLTKEQVPRLEVYYRKQRSQKETEGTAKGADQRLGPYRSRRFLEALLEFVTDHYGLRSCTTMPKQVCLLYHIGKCSGVCAGEISQAEYVDRAQQAAAMLANEGQALIEAMTAKMEAYAEKLEFEKAQNMLMHIRNLELAPDKQIVDREDELNQDVIYFGDRGVIVAKVQEGMLREFQMFEMEAGLKGFACDRFLLSLYTGQWPDEIILNTIGDIRQVRSALRRRGARGLTITLPKRGIKYDLLQLCKNNYEYRMSLKA
ncbi:GIY-YIG nuclease family protein [Paenibacillus sedimenti]|uniref:GIY-YIG nuclease family protein n=1 Tax=Paenibacillus sedimenti TaxID=2770274 RepID=A0A926KVP0_9BACL|nr:GIY-YIG nuclease family protein [Paenibacillus sedimenti]MBD0384016.1 GIY-YIG nuclease family protein [Paenibacillus sedimenti]